MTEVQWDNFKEEMRGKWIVDWTARISDVGDRSLLAGGYPIHMDINADCSLYYVAPDEATALRFSKGQEVHVTSEIDFIDEGLFGGVTLFLEEYTVQIK